MNSIDPASCSIQVIAISEVSDPDGKLTSYCITASIDRSLTYWSGILDGYTTLTHTGWESIDQWADSRILAKQGSAAARTIGEMVLRKASEHLRAANRHVG